MVRVILSLIILFSPVLVFVSFQVPFSKLIGAVTIEVQILTAHEFEPDAAMSEFAQSALAIGGNTLASPIMLVATHCIFFTLSLHIATLAEIVVV